MRSTLLACVSVIIPSADRSRERSLEGLLADLDRQSLRPREVEVVRGLSPNGHARNVGVANTTGEVLVFLDDDVRLGTPNVLASFVEHLTADSGLGLVGTAQLLPPGSSAFQRCCACQLSRTQSPVVDVLTESDMVTTQCCAMRREVLREVGGFHGRLIRGVDPELRYRLRQAGYRIAVVPGAWHYHPMPGSLRELLRMAWRDGAASAYAQRHFPETVLWNPEGHTAHFEARVGAARRRLRRGLGIVRAVAAGQWYGALYGLVYVMGYVQARS